MTIGPVPCMRRFRVTARRVGTDWVLETDQDPTFWIEVPRLTAAYEAAREALAAATSLPVAQIDVVVVPELPEPALDRFERARQLDVQIAELRAEATSEAAAGVQTLSKAYGMTIKEIALATGLTQGVVSRLLRAPAEDSQPLTVRHLQVLRQQKAAPDAR
ncbi:sigma-70 family RNA polymerase sigma factor [Promicromonospora sp. NFX87]|uniref:sigma-70 family RNA polymerase sigma factor n=1 Tax=Promicromonospora sp. NFX87 TaxID=3402691 RepID=UPI003AFAD2D5